MTKIDEVSLKKIIIYLDNESLAIKMVDPKNEEELNTLKKLDKKGLTKFQIIDASASFIAHKEILEKLVDDLSSNSSRPVSGILDRTQESNSVVQIFASNIRLRKYGITPAQFEQLVREENLMLENYKNVRCR